VRVRIPAGSPACLELSGGLDSSSIACMTRKLAGEGRVSPSDLTAVTYTHADSPDESFALLVERWCGITSIRLDVNAYPYIAAGAAGSAVPSWWSARNAELAARMTASSVPVLLSGQIGDLIMGNWHDESDRVADLVRQGSLLLAGAEAHAWSRLLNVPVYWILWRALRLNFPFISPPTGLVTDLPRDGSDSLSDRTRTRAAEILDRSSSEARWRDAPFGRRAHFRMLGEILDSRGLEVPEELYPIFYTHPYAHRPLLEYMLAIPPEIVGGIGEPRRLMRRAFAGLLPPAVLRRRSKASFSEIFARALRPLAEKLLEAPSRTLLATRGYIDVASLERRLRLFLNGLDCNEPQLRRVILVEFWLRSYIASAEAGVSPTPRAGALTESR
jgi:asparagine synthase (glutamine-hydrolysing)